MYCPKCGKELDDNGQCPGCTELEKKKDEFKKHRERVIRKLSIEGIRGSDFKEEVVSEERVVITGGSLPDQDTVVLDTDLQETDTDLQETDGDLQETDGDIQETDADISDTVLPINDTQMMDLKELEAVFADDPDVETMNYIQDDYDASINDASAKKLHAMRKKGRRKGLAKIIIPGIILIAVLFAVSALIMNRWYQERKLEAFSAKCDSFYAVMKENDSDYGEFREVYDLAMQALEAKDYEAFDELSARLQEMQAKMTDMVGDLQSLSDLKAQYENVFSKYVITEEYQAVYDDLNQRLNQAIEERQENVVRDLKKEFESLSINLKTANQQLVQVKQNEITKLDIAKASEEEQSVFEDYRAQVNAVVENGNYAEAVRILDLWLASAQEVERSIRESESREKELRESESRAKESEEESLRQMRESADSENTDSEYLLDGSDSRYVTKEEVLALSAQQRSLARNEIYARHGRRFKDAEIQAYFDSKSWYHGVVAPEDFNENLLNHFEKDNITLIMSLE